MMKQIVNAQTNNNAQNSDVPGQKLCEAVLKCYTLGGFLCDEPDFLKSMSFYACQHMTVREVYKIQQITTQINPNDDKSMDDYVNKYLQVLDNVFKREENLGGTAANILRGVVQLAPEAQEMQNSDIYRVFAQTLSQIKTILGR